jgi:ATP-dependent Lon protease
MKYSYFKEIPVLPIRNTILFPGSVLSLRVGRPKSVTAIQHALNKIRNKSEEKTQESLILVLTQKSETDNEANESNLFRTGTLAKIESIKGTQSQGYQILVRGIERLNVQSLVETKGMLMAVAESSQETMDIDEGTKEAVLKNLRSLSSEILELIPGDTSQLQDLIAGINDVVFLTDLCAANLQMPLSDKQDLLEISSIKFRVLKILEIMQHQKEQLQVQSDIREKISQKFGKTQREHFLREQLKAIKEELGEDDVKIDTELKLKIDSSGMPQDVKKIALEELKRLETIGSMGSEAHVIKNYIAAHNYGHIMAIKKK